MNLKELINSILRPAGLRVMTLTRYHRMLATPRYLVLIKEVQALLSASLHFQLKESEDRVELIAKLVGTGVSEAFYIIEFLHRTLDLPGDICEFGVAQGATSALIANEIRSSPKRLWLFDSFQGLPQPTEKDKLLDDIAGLGSIQEYAGRMSFPASEVRARLSAIGFPSHRFTIVPGFIERTIEGPDLPQQVCFAYIDFDFYEPILVALQFLHERMPPGGNIIVDDYGFFSTGAKTAVEEFRERYPGVYDFQLPYEGAGNFCILHKVA